MRRSSLFVRLWQCLKRPNRTLESVDWSWRLLLVKPLHGNSKGFFQLFKTVHIEFWINWTLWINAEQDDKKNFDNNVRRIEMVFIKFNRRESGDFETKIKFRRNWKRVIRKTGNWCESYALIRGWFVIIGYFIWRSFVPCQPPNAAAIARWWCTKWVLKESSVR